MIKTIRVKKEMTFRELMEYIIQNDVSGDFKCLNEGHEFVVSSNGTFYFDVYRYGDDETYEVEVEEEITEDTEFDRLVQIYDKSYMLIHFSESIREIKKKSTDKIYALIDGELQLVWQRGEENV